MLTSTISLLQHGLASPEFPITMLRVGTGAFFALSGWNKLTNPARHASIVETFQRDKVPFIAFNQWWVPGNELVQGTLLAAGLFTSLAATILAIICIVATCAEARSRVAEYKPINGADKVDDYLYLPEVIYLLVLTYFAVAGSCGYCLDALF